MCTVTFIPARDTFYLTSNRDEKNNRKNAIKPSVYTHHGHKLIYPKDGEAGGTWIAVKENGDAAVLLNGAFIRHTPTPPYRKSRGQLFLDILTAGYPAWTFSKLDLAEIEPFTLIVLENKCLYEFRWDGTEKFGKQLPTHRPHIWSSATLYDGLVVKKREQWFANFLNRTASPTQQDIVNFHRFSGDGDNKNDLLMERDGIYSTVSITSILLNNDRGVMKYLDLKKNTEFEIKLGLIRAGELV